MVIVFRPNFLYRWEYTLRCFNIFNPLSHNLVGCNIYANILIDNSLACRDAKLRALVAMDCFMMTFRELAINIAKGWPKTLANEVCNGPEGVSEQLDVKEQSIFQSLQIHS